MMPLTVTLTGIVFGTLFGIAFFVLVLWGWNGLWTIPARMYREKEIEANKFTWNDVEKRIFDMPPDNIIAVVLRVTNNKPYDIQGAIVKVIGIQKDRFMFEPYANQNTLPLNLCWLIQNGVTWGGRKLHKNKDEPKTLLIAAWLDPNKKPVLMTGYTERENSKGNEKHIELEANSDYLIELQWTGAISDGVISRPLDGFTNRYFLRFDGKKFDLKEAQKHV